MLKPERLAGQCWRIPLSQHSGESPSLRSTWTTEQVLEQPELYRESLSRKNKTKQTNKKPLVIQVS